MSCEHFEESLHAYFTGDLPRERRSDVEAHAASCSKCGNLMKTAKEMTCKELIEFLIEYIDENLSSERKSAFDRHIGICPECQNYLQSYRRTMELSAVSMKDGVREIGESLPLEMILAIVKSRPEK